MSKLKIRKDILCRIPSLGDLLAQPCSEVVLLTFLYE